MVSDWVKNLEVKCYAGYRGEETPVSVRLSGKEIRVEKIMEMWLAPDHRYFKFKGSDGSVYTIRNDVEKGLWELSFFKEFP